jgi:hypothetical protein
MMKNCAGLYFKLQYCFFYQKVLIGNLDEGLLVYTCNHLDNHSWREASQNTYVGTSCTVPRQVKIQVP